MYAFVAKCMPVWVGASLLCAQQLCMSATYETVKVWHLQAASEAALIDQVQTAVVQQLASPDLPTELQFVGGQGLQSAATNRLLQAELQRDAAQGHRLQVVLRDVPTAVGLPARKPLTQAWMRFTAHQQMVVWSLVSDLPKKTLLRCEHLVRGFKRASAVSGKPLQMARCEPSALGVLRHPISANTVLSKADILPDTATLRNEPTTLKVRVGGVVVEAQGQAMADALVGQTVPVRVEGLSATVNARMVAPGLASLSEGVQ